ncbi:SEC14 protein 2 [Daphnia magna]|uniref:SEC14 protein 2 n=1 Tax=Daphnia magna TaxID=35525 RepID=A0A0N8BCR7_9CRUS|nr:SEC14 protein 2 [Daphnia magna]
MVVSCETRGEILKRFKRNIADCNLIDDSDDYIVKWLVARDFDLDQAEKMLRRSVEWRRANRVDEILDQWEPPVALVKYYPMSIIGNDKFYCPVSVVAFGKADWRGILQSVSKTDYLRYLTYMAETNYVLMRKNSLLTGKPVTLQTFIIDMDGLSMRQMSYKPFREVGLEAIKISEANYPESLRRVFIINAPKVFTFVFSMVKPFLHQATLDKISVFGFDRNEWSVALLKEIDADQLPVYYGGTMTDSNGDSKCSSKVNMGEKVPSSYYLDVGRSVPKDDMTFFILTRGTKKKFEFKVVAANSTLKWEFMTEEGDIGFRVYYYAENEKEKVDVVSNARLESHLMMQEGEIVCTRPAIYVVQFDNSYSYFSSKKIWYRVIVDLPSLDKSD